MSALQSYRGKRVLITGHTGFNGSWLALWLRDLGADVFGFALPPAPGPSNFVACRIGDKVHHCEGDLRDRRALRTALEDARPEIVFHLAAQPLVRDSYDDPLGTFEVNVLGTVNVLEAVRAQRSVRAVVLVTSDKCYENREWEHAYRENDPMGGHDPYSASKGCAELVAAAYRTKSDWSCRKFN